MAQQRAQTHPWKTRWQLCCEDDRRYTTVPETRPAADAVSRADLATAYATATETVAGKQTGVSNSP